MMLTKQHIHFKLRQKAVGDELVFCPMNIQIYCRKIFSQSKKRFRGLDRTQGSMPSRAGWGSVSDMNSTTHVVVWSIHSSALLCHQLFNLQKLFWSRSLFHFQYHQDSPIFSNLFQHYVNQSMTMITSSPLFRYWKNKKLSFFNKG